MKTRVATRRCILLLKSSLRSYQNHSMPGIHAIPCHSVLQFSTAEFKDDVELICAELLILCHSSCRFQLCRLSMQESRFGLRENHNQKNQTMHSYGSFRCGTPLRSRMQRLWGVWRGVFLSRERRESAAPFQRESPALLSGISLKGGDFSLLSRNILQHCKALF